MIEQLATLLVTAGISAGQSTLYSLILIYLIVTAFFAGFLIFILLRRRQRGPKRVLPPSDLES